MREEEREREKLWARAAGLELELGARTGVGLGA